MTQRPDPEQVWLDTVYRPGEIQFTLRAVLVGMVLGVVLCLSNVYVFFKTGWSMGVTITAAILAFALFRGFELLRITRRPLTALENNALTTVASGAGYMTAGGNMAAFGALLMVTTLRPDFLPMIGWFAVIALLGVFAAIPIKRQLVNQEALPFPTGTATAATIRTVHSTGPGGEGTWQSRALIAMAIFAATLTWFRDVKFKWMPFNLPATIPLPFSIAGRKLADWTLSLKTEVVLVGAGALMSFRTCWSLLLSGLLTYGVLAPALNDRGWIASVDYKGIVGWTVWPGAALLVASGLTSFAVDYKSIVRAFRGITRIFRRSRGADEHPIEAVECPASWFPLGFLVLSPIAVVLMTVLFQIPWWAGLIAVPLSIVMGFIAARVTGETDVTPTKALGPVTQLLYGAITPGNLSGNIMSANVTGGIGLHAADLLTTLKTGWLLGGNPRVQFYAQCVGVVVGAIVIMPAFDLFISDPAMLGSEEWPAPSCVLWASVSHAFSEGLSSLPDSARLAIVLGLALGVSLALLEKFAPTRLKPYVPSPAGMGLAMVIPGSNVLAMFLGGALAALARRFWRAWADRYVVVMGSGLIAGESLMGIVTAYLRTK